MKKIIASVLMITTVLTAFVAFVSCGKEETVTSDTYETVAISESVTEITETESVATENVATETASEQTTEEETTAVETETEKTTINEPNETTSEIETTTEEETTEETTEFVCTHRYSRTVIKEVGMLEDGEAHYVCQICGDEFDEIIPATRSIKILAFGNSFSDDAFRNLAQVLKDIGFREVILGNLYIGSCSLDMHWENIQSGANAYLYRETKIDGIRVDESNKSVKYAMEKYSWDVITVQQKGNWCGDPSRFGNLSNVINYIYNHRKNKNAKIYWHMTWSYRADVSQSSYSSQIEFYNAIASTTKNTVMKNSRISGLIPCGTSVQNVRTSYIGDNLNDVNDGFHLGVGYGYYTAALTWACAILEVSPYDVDWRPLITENEAEAIKESVQNALKTPYSVTRSTYTVKP